MKRLIQKPQRDKFCVVDLSRIGGSGEFECPKCGTKISPDDKSEDTYIILEPVVKGDRLEKIILQCNKCGSRIHLVGFDIVEN